jgi:hypothetical protein
MERSTCGERRVIDIAVMDRGHEGGARLVPAPIGDPVSRPDELASLKLITSRVESEPSRKEVKVEVSTSTPG